MPPVKIAGTWVTLGETLAELAASHPTVAEHVSRAILRAVQMAQRSGRVTRPQVWVRAFIAATSELASEKWGEAWLEKTPVRYPKTRKA